MGHTAAARPSPPRPRTTAWARGVHGPPHGRAEAPSPTHEATPAHLAWRARAGAMGGGGSKFPMAEELADPFPLGNRGNDPPRSPRAKRKVARLPPPTQWRKTAGHSESTHPLEQPPPTPVRRCGARRRCLDSLLTRRGHDGAAPLTMGRQTPPRAYQMPSWQGHQRCQLCEPFHRRECDARRAVGPGPGAGGEEVAAGLLGKALQRYGASGSIADEACQLVAPMRRDLGVGVQRKPVDAGTAGARECGMFPCIPTARANPAHLLSGPLPKGNALLHGGGRGAGERGFVAHEGIIPRGHGVVAARLQYPRWRTCG